MQSRNETIQRDLRVKRLSTITDNARRQASIPTGFDLHHWQEARLVERVIASAEQAGKMAADLSSCAMSQSEFHDHWYDVQGAVAFGILAGLALDPPPYPEFRAVLHRYRSADREFLALIPAAQWLKDFADWDDRVILFTLRHSIVLPNETARARQEAVAFAWKHAADYFSQVRPSLHGVYMMYRHALAHENTTRAARGEIPFGQLSHQLFRSLVNLECRSNVAAARDGVPVAAPQVNFLNDNGGGAATA